MNNNEQIFSKITKTLRKKFANASEEELLEFLDEISSEKYSNKLNARIESSRQANKPILLIHANIFFDDDIRIESVSNVKWLNEFMEENNKRVDVYIYSPKFKHTDFVTFAENDLVENGLDPKFKNDVNYSGHFIENSVFIYDKSYIYQGKLPSVDVVVDVSKR